MISEKILWTTYWECFCERFVEVQKAGHYREKCQFPLKLWEMKLQINNNQYQLTTILKGVMYYEKECTI